MYAFAHTSHFIRTSFVDSLEISRLLTKQTIRRNNCEPSEIRRNVDYIETSDYVEAPYYHSSSYKIFASSTAMHHNYKRFRGLDNIKVVLH